MNSIFNFFKGFALMAGVALVGASFTACDDQPDKYEATDGVPTIKYVRVTDPQKADSLLVAAPMSSIICLVGDNLRSIHEIYFNDQKAELNTSLITDNTLLVQVPSELPGEVTDKIYMVTVGGQKVDYDFRVIVPAPQARSMACEWVAAGQVATVYGDFFLNTDRKPLQVAFADGTVVNEFTDIQKTQVSFVVPEGVASGYLKFTNDNGTGQSAFQFRDQRNILFDWDGTRGGHATGHGWREGVIHDGSEDGITPIDGKYIVFQGDMLGSIGGTCDEDKFSFNYWPNPDDGNECLRTRPEFASMIKRYGVENLQVKFELYIPSENPWMSSALQVMFTSIDMASRNVTESNDYIFETNGITCPRALWMPWQTGGSYHTADAWTTVSVPLNTFTYNHEGGAATAPLTESLLDGLTFFVWNGGLEGTDCSIKMYIDNIRVVPVE